MSDRIRRLLGAARRTACVGVAASAIASPLGAQQPVNRYDADVAHARALYRAAVTHMSALEKTLDSLKEERRRKHTTDSLRAGDILVRIVGEKLPSASRAALDRAAAGAWTVIAQLNDTAVNAVVTSLPLELTVVERLTPVRARWVTLGFPNAPAASRMFGRSVDEDQARSEILTLLGGGVGARLPKIFVKWLSDWAPLGPPTANDWQRVATELATSRSSLARSCLTTEVTACRTVLDLPDVPPGDRRHAWYRPEDFPALVAEWAPRDSESKALRARCVEDGLAAACESAFNVMPPARPLSEYPKVMLLKYAIAKGGSGAYQRLIGATGTPAEILATAARAPIDTLLAGWRAATVSAPVPRSRPGIAELAAIAVWTLAFGTLAARRRP